MAKKPTEEETVELDPVDAAAAADLASMKPTEAPKGISEEEISEKTRAGLTRDQAIEVITSQRAWDKSQKK
jgi:hypothetical protein